MGIRIDSGTTSRRTSSSKRKEREDTKRTKKAIGGGGERSGNSSSSSSYIERHRPNSKPRGMTQHRWENPTLTSFTGGRSGSSGSSGTGMGALYDSLNLEEDQEKILENAPNKYLTQQYKAPENPNPFYDDFAGEGQRYNTYTRKVRNPEYNEYINSKNEEYKTEYNNHWLGNQEWENVSTNDFETEDMTQGIWGNSEVMSTETSTSDFNSDIDFSQFERGNVADKWLGNLGDALGKAAGGIMGGKQNIGSAFTGGIGSVVGGLTGLQKAFFE